MDGMLDYLLAFLPLRWNPPEEAVDIDGADNGDVDYVRGVSTCAPDEKACMMVVACPSEDEGKSSKFRFSAPSKRGAAEHEAMCAPLRTRTLRKKAKYMRQCCRRFSVSVAVLRYLQIRGSRNGNSESVRYTCWGSARSALLGR